MIHHINENMSKTTIDTIHCLLKKNTGVYAYEFLHSVKRIISKADYHYYMGVYYLEYGKIRWLYDHTYIESSVSRRRARKHIKIAAKHRPKDPAIHFALGESYFRENRFDRAIACYQTAYNGDQTNKHIYWCIIETYYLMNQYDEVVKRGRNFIDQIDQQLSDIDFWILVTTMYAACYLNEFSLLDHILSMISLPIDCIQIDLAAISLIELNCICGNYAMAKKLYKRYNSEIRYVSSLCKDWLADDGSITPWNSQENTAVLASFSPKGLVPHFND